MILISSISGSERHVAFASSSPSDPVGLSAVRLKLTGCPFASTFALPLPSGGAAGLLRWRHAQLRFDGTGGRVVRCLRLLPSPWGRASIPWKPRSRTLQRLRKVRLGEAAPGPKPSQAARMRCSARCRFPRGVAADHRKMPDVGLASAGASGRIRDKWGVVPLPQWLPVLNHGE